MFPSANIQEVKIHPENEKFDTNICSSHIKTLNICREKNK